MKSAWRWILVPAAVLHLCAMSYALSSGEWYLKDSLEYGYAADQLRTAGRLYAGPPDAPFRTEYRSKRPPVYPLLLAGLRSLFGGDAIMLVLQGLLSIATLWWSCRFILRIYPGFSQWKWLSPFVLLYPGQYIYANLVMTELWLQAALLVMTYGLWRAWTAGQLKWFWAYTVMLILGLFTKPVLYLFVGPHLLVGAVYLWRHRRWSVILPMLLPLLLVLGYMQWNENRTGYFHFSSIQNLSLLQYTTTSYLIQTEGYAVAEAKTDTLYYRAQRNPDFGAGQRAIQAGCVDILTEQPGQYLVFHFRGMVNFFLDPGRFDLFTFFQINSTEAAGLFDVYSREGYAGVWTYLWRQPVLLLLLLLVVLLLNLLKIMLLPISLLHAQHDWLQRGILLLFILYIAGLTGVSGASRFAVPVFPLLCLGAAGGIYWIHQWQQRRHRHP